MKVRKITITGSHGTGKTTFANALYEKYKQTKNDQVELVGDYARACPYPIGEKTTVRAQLWIFESYLAKELETECDMIFDGSSLQTLAYYEYRFGKNTDLRKRAKSVVNLCTTVILLPTDMRLCQPDGVRPQSTQFQNDIHVAIVKLLKEFNVNYVSLPCYDSRSRKQFIEELLSSMCPVNTLKVSNKECLENE